jgi:hypothetical protein
MKRAPANLFNSGGPRRVFILYAGIVLLLSAWLSLKGLGNCYFWDDEAIVAITARNFLASGHLTGWDGRNLLAYRDGALLDDQLNNRNPPLDILLTAASFKLFGATTWAGRFPSVVAGLACVALFALLIRGVFGDGSPAAFYALAALAFSTGSLLFIRQCRYYAPAMLFALGVYWAWRRLEVERRPLYSFAAGMAAIGLFFSNYLLAVVFLPALAVARFAMRRGRIPWKDWKLVAPGAIIFLIATAPYALIERIWQRPDMPVSLPWQINKPILLWWHIRELSTIGCLPWMVAAVVLLAALLRRNDALMRPLAEWLVLAGAYIVFLVMASQQPVDRTLYADVRYLVPLIPFLAAAVGAGLGMIHNVTRWGPILATLLLAGMLTTNGLSVTPGKKARAWWQAHAPSEIPFRWLLPAYVGEITHPYPTAFESASEFLRKSARQDDLVCTSPDYANYPLMFYVGAKVKFCCALTERSHLYPKVRSLDAPLLEDENFPDWFLLFRRDPEAAGKIKLFLRPVRAGIVRKYVMVSYLDTYAYDEMSRPEIFWHSFNPAEDFAEVKRGVYIFHKEGEARLP